MPYATNRTDGVRTYFEDDGGDGPPILFYAGLGDPLEYSRANRLTDALRPEYRLIFADHRGHGRSDKPHDEASYDLRTRVGDVLAVLDTLGIERAHFFGFSWGARLGFAVGEHAPDRVRALILCGNQPYEWDPAWPFVPMLFEAFATADEHGMEAYDMRANGERAAAEIPGAQFVALPGHSHLSASEEADLILPHVREVLTASAVDESGCNGRSDGMIPT